MLYRTIFVCGFQSTESNEETLKTEVKENLYAQWITFINFIIKI